MQSEQQQRIMGYFIEEAKDHLNTIEQGLLSLQSTIEDSEMVSELFRAAHSVKGGAAMLGLGSIQKTAHRLEDYFKVLKECPIKVDQKLESFFLRVFDTLQELVEQLQGPFGLTDDKAQEVMAEVEPVFNSLNDHLGLLVSQSGGTPPNDVELGGVKTTIPMPVASRTTVPAQEESALQLIFQSDVPVRLREMLQLFKQADTASTRQQLQNICHSLTQAGEQFDLPNWAALLTLAERAIANPDNSYRTLAPILIKDVKQAQELVLTQRADAIQPSLQLQALAPLAIEDEPIDDFANLLAEIDFEDDGDSTPEFIEFDLEVEEPFGAIADDSTSNETDWFSEGISTQSDFNPEGTFIQPDISSSLLDFDLDLDTSNSIELTNTDPINPDLEDNFGFEGELNQTNPINSVNDRNGPEVGLAELNSLADLFEGEVPDLGMTWQEEVVVSDASSGLFEAPSSSDFSDLLSEPDDLEDLDLEADQADNDLSDLLNTAERREDIGDESLLLESNPKDDLASSNQATNLSANSLNSEEDDPFAALTTLPSTSVPPAESASNSAASGLEDLGELFLNLEEGEFAPLGLEIPSAISENDREAIASTETANETVNPFDILADPFDDSSEVITDLDTSTNDPFALGSSDLDFGEDNALDLGDSEPFTVDTLDFDQNFGDPSSHEGSFENLDLLEDLTADDALIESLIQLDDSPTTLSDLGGETIPELGSNQVFDAWAALDAEEELDLSFVDPTVPDQDITSDLWGDVADQAIPTPAIATPASEALTAPLDDPFAALDLSDSDLSGFDALMTDDVNSASNNEIFDFSLESDELEPDGLEGADSTPSEPISELDSFDILWEQENDEDPSAPTTPAFTDALADPVTDQSLEDLFADDVESSTTDQSLEGLFADDIDRPQSFDLATDELRSEAIEAAPLTSVGFSTTSNLNDLLDTEAELADLLMGDLADDESDVSALFGEAGSESADPFADAFLDLPDLDNSELNREADPSSDLSNLFEEDAFAFDPSLLEDIPTQSSEAESFEAGLLIEEFSLESDNAAIDLTASESSASEVSELNAFDELEEPLASVAPEDLSGDTVARGPSSQPDDISDVTFDYDLPDIALSADEASDLDLNFDLPEIGSRSSELSDLDFDLDFDSVSMADEPSATSADAITNLDVDSSDLDAHNVEEPDGAVPSAVAEPIADLEAAMFEFDSQPDFPRSSTDIANLEVLDLGEQTLDMDEALGNVTFEESVFNAMLTNAESGTDDSAFDELDALLSEELMEADASAPEETEELDSFADLDVLLEQSFTELDANESFDHSNAAVELGADDDFTDLDALLAGDLSSLEEPTNVLLEEDEFDSLDLLLSESPTSPPMLDMVMESASQTSGGSSEFDDLEKLLEDADQTLGGPPTTRGARGPSLPPSRSKVVRPTRGILNDQTMRVSVKNLDNLNNLVGELVVNRNSLEQAEERLRQFLDNLLYQVQQLGDVGQRMRDLYERSLLESSLLSNRKSYQTSPPGNGGLSQSSHVTGASFDALEMDRFTGFHTLSQEMIELIVRVRESASDIDFVVDETDQVTRNFRQITTQLQEGLTRSRMVPFAQTADRLPRAVRDISLQCGKQAELAIEGRDTLIDKMILEQLYDPMTHLVNNAITHGIETPEERSVAGKPSIGRITVRTFHQGNQTVISVSDDGAGINPEFVKRKAIERGLITSAEAGSMARLDVYDLLFHHGFSTKDKADDFAGRGVGMDVVRTSLNEIRGVINIDSTVGRGTTFTIRLPLTLSISKALCCISNRARIAFPMDGVEDMLDVPKERIQRDSQDRPCIQWRDQLLPFQPLSELLRYNRNLGRGSVYGGNQEDDIVSVVVLRSNAGNYLALQVDQVLGEQEIVIKQLEGPVPKPIGVAGATVLGDGRIMPIADVLELIDLSLGRIRREAGSSLWEKDNDDQLPPEVLETKTEPTVLIVDDSITVRELLSMTFNKIGYRVEQARDGQEAWEKLRSGLPCDIVFCDIEMPRMDGLELLSRIQKDSTLSHLPIAMLTSRGADRHRQMAVQLGAKGYFTKPYLEEALLDAAQRMLKGEVLVNPSS